MDREDDLKDLLAGKKDKDNKEKDKERDDVPLSAEKVRDADKVNRNRSGSAFGRDNKHRKSKSFGTGFL
jgi:hypothetical protein